MSGSFTQVSAAQWDHTWGEAGEIAVVNYVGLCVNVNRANGWKNDWPLSCVEVVK